MLQRYSFIPVFLLMFLGLDWWSAHFQVDPQSFQPEETSVTSNPIKNDLIETLDKIVAYQHYYHSVYGHFTQLLTRIGFRVPSSLTDFYEIRVSEASTDRLLITAFSEQNGPQNGQLNERTRDLISIDQDFQVHANFELPPPRSEYLRSTALKYMRLLKNSPNGQVVAEGGVYKGYFNYSTGVDSKNERIAKAEGVREPVLGMKLVLDSQTELESNWGTSELPPTDEIESGLTGASSGQFANRADETGAVRTGQHQDDSPAQLEEEAYLAQKIFHGEMGRYAKTWSELSKIAHFHFEGKAQFGGDTEVPFGEVSSRLSSEKTNILDLSPGSASKKVEKSSKGTQARGRTITSHMKVVDKPLEIEPISTDETR